MAARYLTLVIDYSIELNVIRHVIDEEGISFDGTPGCCLEIGFIGMTPMKSM